jgi:hypothetical protein
MIGEILPKHPKVPFDARQQAADQEGNLQRDRQVYRHCGQKETVIFCDRIMALGFRRRCKAGISFGKDDMVVPLQEEARRRDAQRGQGIRAAISGRPDHPGREVQQGGRRLVEVHREASPTR